MTIKRREKPCDEAAEDASSVGLMMEHKAGDPDAMGELYKRYRGRIYPYVVVALRDLNAAEDVMQDVFVRVLGASDRYEPTPGVPLRAWLFQITRNAVIDALRREGRVVTMSDSRRFDELREADRSAERPDPVELLGRDVLRDEVFHALGRLPFDQRRVVVLRYLLEVDVAEVAAIIGRTTNAVCQLSARAMKTLRELLKPLELGPKRVIRTPVLVRLRPARILVERRFALWRSPPLACRVHPYEQFRPY